MTIIGFTCTWKGVGVCCVINSDGEWEGPPDLVPQLERGFGAGKVDPSTGEPAFSDTETRIIHACSRLGGWPITVNPNTDIAPDWDKADEAKWTVEN
jgi:hypothetical protein